MKKFISLVMALVMALSLTTIAWGADAVSTDVELAEKLTANVETISVVLQSDIDLPISSLGTITPGSGEYKLGGDSTKNIVIDLNGKKLNITTTYWSAIGAKNADATITIKNGTMTSTGNSAGTWNAWDVRLCNCNYVIENVTFEKAVALDNAGKTTKMTNVIINENSGDKYALWITAEGQAVEIDGLTINSSTGRGIKIDEQYVDASAKVTLDVSKAEFNTAKKSAIMVKSAAGADITASNCDISAVAEDSTTLVWVDEDAAAYTNLVSVTGATALVEGTSATVVAQVNGIKYTTLAAAVAAAADGDTIVLLADCAESATVPVITLDTNGYAYTGTLTAPAGYEAVYTSGAYMVVPKTSAAGTTTTLKDADKYDIYPVAGTTSVKAANANITKKVVGNAIAADGTVTYTATTYSDGANVYVEVDSAVADYKLVQGNMVVAYMVNLADVGYVPTTTKTVTSYVAAVEKAACGQYSKATYPAGVYMIDGKAYAAGGANWALYNGKFVNYGGVATAVPHTYAVNTYNTTDKSVATLKCSVCKQVFTVLTPAQVKTMAPSAFTVATVGNTDYFIAVATAPVVTPSTDKVTSAETFDAGIAMYVGMSVMAAAGSAVVLKKKD